MTGQRGRRNARGEQLRASNRLVSQYAFYDRKKAERANTLSTDRLMALVIQSVGDCSLNIADRYDPGEILTDNKGFGSKQISDIKKAEESLISRGWER